MSITPDTLTIEEAGKPRELFMSFGLLHELLSRVGDLPAISTMAIDPELRVDVLNSVLAPRDDRGVVTEPVSMFTLKITAEHVHQIVSWAAAHCLDFFLTAIERNLATHATHRDRLIGSTASGTGSPS